VSDETPPIRSRSRIPAGPAAQPETTNGGITPTIAATSPRQQPAGGADWMKTGAAARETSAAELARNQERERQRAAGIFMPYRFWLPVGKQVELVLLDNEPGPCFYEHQLQDPRTGKWDIYEGCPKEYEHCPLCDGVAGGKDSYYVMMLTAIVMDPYINKNGVTVPHSRKLLAVKTNDQPFFQRQFEANGTLRGRQYLMVRDSKQSPSIGRAEFLAAHSEDAILASFGHPQVTASDGKVIKQANADCYPYPYAQIWTRPSGEDLRRRYGGAAPIGSPAGNAAMIGSGQARPQPAAFDTDLDDQIPF
jgi:hypothetical protein